MNRKKIKLFILLNDEIFWAKYINIAINLSSLKRMREVRTKYIIPRKDTFLKFIEDYKVVTWDSRKNKEIVLDLLSEIKEENE